MKSIRLVTAAVAIALATTSPAGAQYLHGGSHGAEVPHLHTSSRWKECSFQLDPALTREAWQQFTREAGMVIYFRPLLDARPMGKGSFEVSAMQWKTGIDDADAAWNDTFVHPDAEHYLFDGPRLPLPGLTARAGITDGMDVGVMYTRNPNANYGVYGAQLQQSLVRNANSGSYLSARVSYSALFGPEDMGFDVSGLDIVGSKSLSLTRRVTLSPYAVVSGFLTRSQERSAVVNLGDESAVGMQATGGATLSGYGIRLAMEYNAATVSTISVKVGFGR
jgi:hypothetical protein